jgi:hypothetical protein
LFHAAWSDELAVSYKEFEESEKYRRDRARSGMNAQCEK